MNNGFIKDRKLKKHKYEGLAQAKRHDINPFFESYEIEFTKKFIQQVGQTKRENLVDEETGEITYLNVDIYEYRMMDNDRFVKVFINQLEGIINLSQTGEKMFKYLLTKLGRNTDVFVLDKADCLKFTKWKTLTSVFKALVELVNEGVIAKAEFENHYYINPAMFINGDRFTVYNKYERDLGNKPSPRRFTEKKRTEI